MLTGENNISNEMAGGGSVRDTKTVGRRFLEIGRNNTESGEDGK